MKKIIIAVLALLMAGAINAQISRITLGLGAGSATNISKDIVKNQLGPLGTFNFGYTVLDSVNQDVKLGFRTGLNATYTRIGMTAECNESFSNEDYYGHIIDYNVTTSGVSYKQRQVNLELPVMFAIFSKGLYCNIGVKLMTPVWNNYEQHLNNPSISAYYGIYSETIVDELETGMVTDEQKYMTGKVSIPRLMVSLSAEIGYIWKLKNNSNIGFDLFVDYAPWCFLDATESNRNVVEVMPIYNDREQPFANVTVNPLTECNGFKFQYLNFGIKLVYAFDIDSKE